MSEQDMICNHCKDVVFAAETTYRIQEGYFDPYGQFKSLGKTKIHHERCHKLIEARAIVMADLSRALRPELWDILMKNRMEG